MQVLTNDHFEKIMNLFDGINNKIKIVSPQQVTTAYQEMLQLALDV